MKKTFLSRKEEIILTTVSLIHEMGVHQVSMKEIGNREGVSEASLYKHFKNKEELLSGVLEHYKQYDVHINSTFNHEEDNAANDIRRYFCIYAEYYGNYKEITSLLGACDTLLHDKALAGQIKEIDEAKSTFMTELVEKAQAEGGISSSIEPEDLSNILLGTFYEIIRIWRMQEYSFSLKERVDETISNLVEVYSKKRR